MQEPRQRAVQSLRNSSSSNKNNNNNSPRTTTRSFSSPLQRVKRSSKLSPVFVYAVFLLVFLGLLKLTIHSYNQTTILLHDTASQQQQQQQLPSTPPTSISKVKQEFYERYGGQPMAESLLNRGVESFGSLQVTAERMLRAAAQQRPFHMAFAGYSVTVGRGNHFKESFPFVVERILQEPLLEILGTSLSVKNAAIGGIPSFPYGFCLEHFLGSDADVISWDYSMNEGNTANILESYLRHGMQLPRKPMLILLDSNRQRKNLLKQYADLNIVRDAISVSRADGVIDKQLLEKPDEDLPEGLRRWKEFGAPNGCPGRSPWHPKKQEHEMIGWMIAMHMIQALEQAYSMTVSNPNWKQTYAQDDSLQKISFPAPLVKPPQNDPAVTQVLYGHSNKDEYNVKNLSCRTSFLPASDEEKVLPSIVVSGMADVDLDMMEERPDTLYQQGWVLDVSKVERDTKKKVERCGGLGYIDMKVALYGIPDSGTLRMWLPQSTEENPPNELNARDLFGDVVIICEANEKRDDKACQLDRDIKYTVGGVVSDKVSSIDGAGVYLKRRTCYSVGIPETAKVTSWKDVKQADGTELPPATLSRLGQSSNDDAVGLVVDVSIRHGTSVSRQNGACCLSHVIWEQQH